MSKIYKAYVYEIEGTATGRPYFEGEIDGITMRSISPELRSEPCVFVNDTKAGLLASMVLYLKAKGHSGVLRVV